MDRDKRTMALHCGECTEADSDARAAAQRTLAPRRSKLKTSGKKLRRERREKKVQARAALHRGVREQAMERSGGQCEAFDFTGDEPHHHVRAGWSRCERRAVEHDHFFGRAKDKTLFGSWMHCSLHASAKTDNVPSHAFWLHSFLVHLAYVRLHEFNTRTVEAYTERARKAKGLLAIEAAQHPNLSKETV